MCFWILRWWPVLETSDLLRLLLTHPRFLTSQQAQWDLEGRLVMLPQVSYTYVFRFFHLFTFVVA